MTLFERVSELAKKQGKSLNKVAEDNKLSKNALYQWRTSSPKAETLELIANYFHVSTDYLLGRTNDPNASAAPEKRKMTVEEALATVMSSDGKPLTDNDREILSAMIEAYLEKKDN
jgi:transcriptional regulator with XRE-family HTH domain